MSVCDSSEVLWFLYCRYWAAGCALCLFQWDVVNNFSCRCKYFFGSGVFYQSLTFVAMLVQQRGRFDRLIWGRFGHTHGDVLVWGHFDWTLGCLVGR